jgi:hypothetical protein
MRKDIKEFQSIEDGNSELPITGSNQGMQQKRFLD